MSQVVIDAMLEVARQMMGRSPTPAERQRLESLYHGSNAGKPDQRAIDALAKFFGISEWDLQERANASDNTNRAVQDLRNVAKDWQPKK